MRINQSNPRSMGNGLHLVVGDLADSDHLYLHKSMLLSISFNNNSETVFIAFPGDKFEPLFCSPLA
jgi:hypothetical protein